MSVPRTAEAVVVGAGPAGSATALRLARAGRSVLVLDRARFPRDKACSEYLSPETLRQLALLGALERVEAAGVPLEGASVVGARGSRLTGLFAASPVAPFRSTGLSLERRILDHALVEAARDAGARVVEGAQVVSLTYDRGAVSGVLVRREGRLEAIRSRVVIGADGLHSVVARLLGGRRYGRPARYAFVAHVEGVRDLGRTAELHVGPEGYVGLNLIGPDKANVALVVPAARARSARGDPTGFWTAALESFPGVRGRVAPGRIVRPVFVTGPFAAWSSRVAAGGALLVGDAADFFDPFTGEGICAALRGAALAEPILVAALEGRGPVTAAALAGYPSARRRAFGGKWVVERMIGYGMLAPRLFDRAIGRLERRNLAHTLIGVTGDFVPPSAVLRPGFLAAMLV